MAIESASIVNRVDALDRRNICADLGAIYASPVQQRARLAAPIREFCRVIYAAAVTTKHIPGTTMTTSKALDNRELIEKALIMLVGFLASGVLGLLRMAVLASQFGTGAARDSFSSAQQIPEIVFVLVAGGALGSSFIPIYARIREADPQDAWRLASAVMTLTATAAAILAAIVYVFAPQIVSGVLSPGRPIEQQQLTVDMIRLMMLTPFIFSISGLIMGILQSHAVFWLPAIAISMNNIGIIIGALFIAPALPAHPNVGQLGDLNVMGLAYGAVLSAALHLLVQLPGLFKLKAPLRPLFDWRAPGVLDVLRLMGPRVLGLAVVHVNFVVNINLANNMVEGSVAALRIAYTLMFFALGVIGQSVGSAVFPSLAALWAEGDLEGFKTRMSLAMRNVLFLSFPATVLFVMLGEPIFSIFERGEWTGESTQAAAWALGFYALGIAGFHAFGGAVPGLLCPGRHADAGRHRHWRHGDQYRSEPDIHPVHRRSQQPGAWRVRGLGAGECLDHPGRISCAVVADKPSPERAWPCRRQARSRHLTQRRRKSAGGAYHGH